MRTQHVGRRGYIPLKYQVMGAILLLVIPVLILLSLSNYLATQASLRASDALLQTQTEASISNSLKLVNTAYNMFEQPLEPQIQKAYAPFLAAYAASGGRPESIDLAAVKQEAEAMTGLELQLYIIDADSVVRYTTDVVDVGLDFKVVSPDFVSSLTNVRLGDTIAFGALGTHLLTNNYLKWAYYPTPDHRYVLEYGAVIRSLAQFAGDLDPLKLAAALKTLNPAVDEIRIYNYNGRLMTPEKMINVDQATQTMVQEIIQGKRGTLEIADAAQQTLTRYFLVDLPDRKMTPGVHTDRVIGVTYNSRLINEALNRQMRLNVLISLAAVALVLLVAIVIARLITRPIEALTATAAAIKDGNLNTHAVPAGSVELVTLAQTFNSMAERLQKAFHTLQVSEAKYRSLFEDSKDAIFITSMDGQLVDLNPAGLTLLGFCADQIQALNVADFYAVPDDRRRFREAIEQYQAVSDFEVTLRRHDGSQFAALITATLRYAEEGSVVGYQGIIRDITLQKHNERLQAENLRLSTELEVTQRLQRMLLPKQHELLAIDGLDIAGYMQPADEVGGDYYDVLRHNGHVKIGIGDVTGHGLESGVLMLMTQMGVRTLLTHNETNPVQFIDVLNRTIYDNVQRMEIDKNLTLALLDYVADPHNGGGQLKASGQHEELIVVRQGGQVELVNTLDLGFPIGLDNDIAGFVNQITLELQPGDGVVLYTDGITEAENIAGEQYGLERLCVVISRYWAVSADAIKEAVIADVRDFIGTQTVFDDITLLVLKQK